MKTRELERLLRSFAKTDHYHALLEERKDNPCTKDEQEGYQEETNDL